jgi:hydrogenase nickel incorporation protein HypA/HybF
MHEYSLVQAMFDQIGGIVRERNAVAVRRVRVRIGRLAGVEPQLFRTAYEVYRIDTLCADAPLDIADVDDSDDLILDRLELEVA